MKNRGFHRLGASPARISIVFLATLLLVVGLGTLYVFLTPRQPVKPAPASVPYDGYDFGAEDSDRIVDIGTVPGSLNSIFNSVCMMHDRVLREQLAAEGWHLREHYFNNGSEMLAYADRLDIMFIGDIPALTAAVKFNFGIFANSRQSYNTIVASRLLTPSDLKGLRVGYPYKTTSHFAIARALRTVGMTLDDIVSVPMLMKEMDGALRSHTVDAVVAWEPTATTLLEKVPGSAIVFRSTSLGFVLMQLDFAARHPRIHQALLAATARTSHWTRQDDRNILRGLEWVKQANLAYSGKSLVDPDSRGVALYRLETIDNPSFPMLSPRLIETNGLLFQQFQFVQEIGEVPADVEWNAILSRVDTGSLPKIVANGTTWQIDRFDFTADNPEPESTGKAR